MGGYGHPRLAGHIRARSSSQSGAVAGQYRTVSYGVRFALKRTRSEVAGRDGLQADRYADASAVLGAAGACLATAEVENNLMLTIASSVAD